MASYRQRLCWHCVSVQWMTTPRSVVKDCVNTSISSISLTNTKIWLNQFCLLKWGPVRVTYLTNKKVSKISCHCPFTYFLFYCISILIVTEEGGGGLLSWVWKLDGNKTSYMTSNNSTPTITSFHGKPVTPIAKANTNIASTILDNRNIASTILDSIIILPVLF